MKTTIRILLFLVAMISASCNNKMGMTTVVNKDGSCYREVTFHLNDSAQLVSGRIDSSELFLHLDNNWKLVWMIEGEKTRHPFPMTRLQYDSIQNAISDPNKTVCSVVQVIAFSSWASAEEMGKHTKFTLNGGDITPKTELIRSFKWFYTDYTYKETYQKQIIKFKVPLEKYLSKDEIGYWYTGKPNLGNGMNGFELDDLMDGIKQKHSKWLCENWFELSYDAIIKNYSSITNAPVSRQHFIVTHDSLSYSFIKKNKDMTNILDNPTNQFYKEFFHTDAYSSILNNETIMKEAQAALIRVESLKALSVDYELVLPGKIINDGGGIVDNNAIRFKLSGERMIPTDFTITAQSRITNIWAFIVTAVVILLTLTTFFIRPKKRKSFRM